MIDAATHHLSPYGYCIWVIGLLSPVGLIGYKLSIVATIVYFAWVVIMPAAVNCLLDPCQPVYGANLVHFGQFCWLLALAHALAA